MPIANSNGIKINYKTYGEGKPVVLISGLGSQLGSWETQIPIYSENFRVVVFDNRGVGMSEKPDYPYTIEMMADDTVGLIDSLGMDKAHFIGKSMGGMVTQWIGVKYPDRVDKLVIGCSSASRDIVGNSILDLGREITTKIGPKSGWFMAYLLGYSRDYIEKNFESMIAALDLIPDDPDVIKGYMNQSHACENHDIIDQLHKITAETLVMYGERDLITSPRRSVQIAEAVPHSTVKCFKNVGHGFWRERQEEVDKLVLEFLSN